MSCKTYECHVGFRETVVAGIHTPVSFHPGKEILHYAAVPPDFRDIENLVLPTLLRRDYRNASGRIDLAPELVTVISPVGKDDLTLYILENIQRRQDFMFVSGPEQQE